MVKFGERYPKLQHVGWSQYYVDYEGSVDPEDLYLKRFQMGYRATT